MNIYFISEREIHHKDMGDEDDEDYDLDFMFRYRSMCILATN